MTDIPPNIRVLKNGAWYDMDRHRLTAGGDIKTAITTSERGRELNEIRREKIARLARKEIARRAEQAKADGKSMMPSEAVAYLAGEAFDSALANMMDKPREAVEAGKFALRVSDTMPKDEQQRGPVAAVQIIMAPEAKDFVDGLWTEDGE